MPRRLSGSKNVEGGINVAESVSAGADETDAQLAGVFVVATCVRRKRILVTFWQKKVIDF